MTSNDLEMTFSSVFQTYLIFGPSFCPLKIKKMEITPPYYHRYHTLVYIFKKICSEKATFEKNLKYDMNIFICSSCPRPAPLPILNPYYQVGLKEKISFKKKITKYLLSSQSYVLFSKSAMTFELKNSRWPPWAAILDFENWTYLCNGSRYRHSLFFK